MKFVSIYKLYSNGISIIQLSYTLINMIFNPFAKNMITCHIYLIFHLEKDIDKPVRQSTIAIITINCSYFTLL